MIVTTYRILGLNYNRSINMQYNGTETQWQPSDMHDSYTYSSYEDAFAEFPQCLDEDIKSVVIVRDEYDSEQDEGFSTVVYENEPVIIEFME